MTQTSLGGISNSASKVFTNAKANMALVNYGKIQGAISTYDFNAQNSYNQNSSFTTNVNSNTNFINSGVWSGTYSENKIW